MPTRSLESAKLVNEKILQRYVFEKLSESVATRRALLPSRLHSSAAHFRVLIPEYNLRNPDHRADFRLIFSDRSGQNIEVEWTTSRFTHSESVARTYYAEGKGFLITLDNDSNKAREYVRPLEVVTIRPSEFSWWFSKNSRKLLDGTIAVHTKNYKVRPPKYWVIYIGKQARAMRDYLEIGRPKGIWAFRYAHGENLRNILSIMTGDIVAFASKWRVPGGRKIDPAGEWTCSHVDILEVSRGYWCDFDDKTFEDAGWNLKPEDKEYMLYFRFRTAADKELLYRTKVDFTLRGKDFRKEEPDDVELCDALRKSNTQPGAPVEISENAIDSLRRRLP